MNNQTLKSNSSHANLKIWLFAFISVIIFSLAYYFLLYSSVSAVVHDYQKTDMVQKFFIYSLILLVPVFIFSPLILRKFIANKKNLYQYLMYFGFLAVLTGLLGLISISFRSSLTGAGGLFPNLGHTLCAQTIDGALWLLFCYISFIPYLYGYFWRKPLVTRFERFGLWFTGGVALYFTCLALFVAVLWITAP